MAAYEIRDPAEFRFLVESAARSKALDRPMSETEPLLAMKAEKVQRMIADQEVERATLQGAERSAAG